jgi:hypothetical protein
MGKRRKKKAVRRARNLAGMANASGTDTETKDAAKENGAPPQRLNGSTAWRTLVFVAIAAASAGLAYAIVRSTLQRPPADPTTERIQSLIDEANRLLRALDDQKRG